jgi:hypothetical protein
VNPPGPVHRNVTPAVGEAPVSVTDVLVQVNIPITEAVAPGNVLLGCTVTVAVDVHPFAGLVTVSVYTPGTEVVAFCDVELKPPGPVHRKVTPAVGEEPINVTLGFVHVSVPETEAVAPGAVVFVFTTAVSEVLQLFPDMVTVYVPGALTVGFCWVEVNPPGPVQLKVTPVAFVSVAVNVTDVVVQVSVPPVAVTWQVVTHWPK